MTTQSTFVTSSSTFIGSQGLVFDNGGNLYCATNNKIIKITSGGSVTTFVSSGLNGPTGLAFDGLGNLYCSNSNSNTISKITSGGSVSTFVSSGLNNPKGLAFYGGTLYCANTNSNTISRITSGGSVTIFVSSGLTGPTSLAFANGGTLYCANNNNTISRITSGGSVTIFVSSGLNSPKGLAFDRSGNLYCSNSNSISKITSVGSVSTFASDLTNPTGLVFDNSDILYSASSSISSIIKISLSPLLSNFSFTTKTFGDSDFQIIAPSTNSPGTFSYISSNTSVATISGTTVIINGGGTTTITATQQAINNYASETIEADFEVERAPTLGNFSFTTKIFGDSDFEIIAPSTNSYGGFSYTSSNELVATISATMVTIVGVGITTITATQEATDTNSFTSGEIHADFEVNKAVPNISFSLYPQTFGDSDFQIIAPSTNSPGTFSYISSNEQVATISENQVTIVGSGTTYITATQSETDNYFSHEATAELVVSKAIPNISFSLDPKILGEIPFIIAATSDSNGAFIYTSSNDQVATISENQVTIVGSGTTYITAFQSETDNYISFSAESTLLVSHVVVVNQTDPTLSFSLEPKTFGDIPFITAPTSDSDGAFTYISSDENVATITNVGLVTIVGAGTTYITATQAETDNYNEAQTIAEFVVSKANPILGDFSFTTKTFGVGDSQFAVTAPSSNSLGTFTYTSSIGSVATINSDTGIVTIVGAGNTTITATQEATSNYNSGTIPASFQVNQANPSLSNFSVPSKIFGDSSFQIIAPSSNSSGSFSYTSSNTSVASISGTTITIVGAGTTTITATQAATANHNEYQTTAEFVVSKADPLETGIAFSVPSKTFGNTSFAVTAPTSTNTVGAFTYTSSNANFATINSATGMVTIVGAGTTTITATQAATANYNSFSVESALVVDRANPTLGNFSFTIKTFGDSSFQIIAPSSNSPGTFSYTSSNTSVASISGTTVTIVGAGTTTITATQAETANYTSGTKEAIFRVSKAATALGNFSVPIKTFGDSSFQIIAPSTNSPGTFSYTSNNTSVASISGTTITIVGAGTTTITAFQPSTTNYSTGIKEAIFQVNQATQTNPVIINNSNELLYFMNTSSSYANITNNLEINDDLIASSYKVLTGNDVKITKSNN